MTGILVILAAVVVLAIVLIARTTPAPKGSAAAAQLELIERKVRYRNIVVNHRRASDQVVRDFDRLAAEMEE